MQPPRFPDNVGPCWLSFAGEGENGGRVAGGVSGWREGGSRGRLAQGWGGVCGVTPGPSLVSLAQAAQSCTSNFADTAPSRPIEAVWA